jgi:hypothetical protein
VQSAEEACCRPSRLLYPASTAVTDQGSLGAACAANNMQMSNCSVRVQTPAQCRLGSLPAAGHRVHTSLQRHSYIPSSTLKCRSTTSPALRQPLGGLSSSRQPHRARHSMVITAMAGNISIGWIGVGTLGLPMVRHSLTHVQMSAVSMHQPVISTRENHGVSLAYKSASPVLKPNDTLHR